VPEYDVRGIVLDPAEGDETTALGLRLTSWKLEGLGIAVDGWLRILPQNGRLPPVLEGRRRPRIDVFGLGVVGRRLPRMILTRL